MSSIQIPNLPAVIGLSGAELFEGVQAGTSVKISLLQIAEAVWQQNVPILPLPVYLGGTGFSTYTVGDILYASGTQALSKLADVATGNAIISGGVGAAPSYGKIGLTTHVSGVLPVANGGTGVTTSTGTGSVVLSNNPTFTGQVSLADGTAAAPSLTNTGDTNTGVFFPDLDTVGLGTDGAERMRINASGNVGIGTTYADTRLVVSNTSALPSVPAVGSSGNLLTFTVDNQFGGHPNNGLIGGLLTNGSFFFQSQAIGGGSGTFNILLNPNGGNLGIGTASPGAKFVVSNDGVGGIEFSPGSFGVFTTYKNASTSAYIINVSKASQHTFSVNNNTTFDIAASSVESAVPLSIPDGSASAPSLTKTGNTNTGFFFPAADTVSLGTGGTERLRIASAGQIGIGGANYGTTGQTVVSAGSAAAPAWGTLPVAGGGTGQANNLTQYGVVYGSTTTAMATTGAGTTTTVLHGNAAGAPTFGAVSLTADVSGTLPLANGGTNATTGAGAFANMMGYTATATAGATTTLTNTSTQYQLFTGTLTQTITLPVTTSAFSTGWTFHIVNNSTGNLTVNASSGALVCTILPQMTAMVTCISTAVTDATAWEFGFTDFGSVTGTGAVVLGTGPTITNGVYTGTVGAAGASTGAFTTLSASSTVSGTGFSTYLASPPAIGETLAASVKGSSITSESIITDGFITHANGTLALGFGTDGVCKVTPNATGTFTTTVPPAGTRCTLIVLTSGITSFTMTFGTGFKTTGTLTTGTVSARYFIFQFISDGTSVIEASRTVAIA